MLNRTLFAVALALSLAAHAQEYPSRPVKVVVPFPAGGASDVLARIVAEKLQVKWGQPFLVENRSGAAGNIGAESVFRAEPDGYTLLSAPPPPLVINKRLYAKLAYDSDAFVPVTLIAVVPNVLMVHPKVGVNSVQELIAFAKANPDRLNYASQGSGGTAHLTAEMLKSMAGIKIVHVPYKGTAPALTDLLAGQVQMMFENLASSLPHIRAGKVKALAVGGEKRSPFLPDVPAMSEVLPGFVSVTWFGVVAPPRTPPDISSRLSGAIAEVLRLPDVAKKLAEMSAEPGGITPAEMGAFMRREADLWGGVIRFAGVKVD